MALLKYTVLRLALFVAVAAGLYVVGVRNLWFNALFAILISGALSLVLLDRVRNDAGVSVGLLAQKIDTATTAEDDADDAAREPTHAEPESEGTAASDPERPA
jgi:hypothetical protein